MDTCDPQSGRHEDENGSTDQYTPYHRYHIGGPHEVDGLEQTLGELVMVSSIISWIE